MMGPQDVRVVVEVIIDRRRLRRETMTVWPDAAVGAAEEQMLFGEAVDRLLRAGAFALQHAEVSEGEVLAIDGAGDRLRGHVSVGRAHARLSRRD